MVQVVFGHRHEVLLYMCQIKALVFLTLWKGLSPNLSVPACCLWMEISCSIVLQRKTLMKNEVNEDGSVAVSALV